MTRPILLGIVGDSGAGKATLGSGLAAVLGEGRVLRFSADDYHRFDRRQRVQHALTPLDPACNHLDVLEQDLAHLRAGEPILKPVYRHEDGSFAASEYFVPAPFTIVEGLLGLYTKAARDAYDVRVFLDPAEDLRRRWKVQRDCSDCGYTTDQVLEELDRREGDAEAFVRPQRHQADVVISFMAGDRGDAELDAKIVLRPRVTCPDLSAVAGGEEDGISLVQRGGETTVWVRGSLGAERGAAARAAILEQIERSSEIDSDRLGELVVGAEVHRSEALAIAELLILHQLLAAAAEIDAMESAVAAPASDADPDIAPAAL